MRILTRTLILMIHILGSQACVSANGAPEYDVVIYGGTSAAVIAAVQARKMEKSVVIISLAS